jgi:hypothetical protein
MDARTKLVMSLVMSSVMVLMVTLLATFINLGLPSDFFLQWMKAYFLGWPVAAITAFFIMAPARRLTERIVSLIDPARRH